MKRSRTTTINFPTSPADGDTYTDPAGYQWTCQIFNGAVTWSKLSTIGYTGTVTAGTKTLTFDAGVLIAVA